MLNDLRSRHLSGLIGGQVAVCSVHPRVLAAVAAGAKKDDTLVLVKATANQVNLSGGYSGMTPADFADHMARLAADHGLAPEHVLLGADHLGPHLWRQLPAVEAMAHIENELPGLAHPSDLMPTPAEDMQMQREVSVDSRTLY